MLNQHRQKSNKQKGNNEGLEIRPLEFLVHLMVPKRVREESVGDLLEEWSSSIVRRFGKLKADGWLPVDSVSDSYGMCLDSRAIHWR